MYIIVAKNKRIMCRLSAELAQSLQDHFFFFSSNLKHYVKCEVNEGAHCWWRRWLRNCATKRKVAGSIPDGVIGIFHSHNPSGRTIALGLTQPLTEMNNSNISWGVEAAGA
jgi:hypothetical protein